MPFTLIDDYEDNPLPEITEMRFEIDGSEEPKLHMDLRFGLIELTLEFSQYTLGATKAELALELEGFKPKIGPRLGDQNTLAATVSEAQRARSSRSGAINAMFSGGTPKVEVGLGASGQSERESFITHERQNDGIKALPNGRWRIKDANGKNAPIEATVLRGEVLLSLKPIPAANRYKVSVGLSCDRRDIDTRSNGPRRRVRQVNRERLIQMIAERSIQNRQKGVGTSTSSRICLSFSSQEFREADDG